MSWTRLDDGFTDRPILGGLPYDVRWHYLALIQFCSRTSRYDGTMRPADARRCSDVPDPEAAVQALVDVGLVTRNGDTVRVNLIDEHIPPPSVRDASEKAKLRMQRHRKHKNGDHSECLSENCNQALVGPPEVSVTSSVTRNTGTGQDRTGREVQQSPDSQVFKGPDENKETSAPTTADDYDDAAWLAGTSHCRGCRGRLDPALRPASTHPGCEPSVELSSTG